MVTKYDTAISIIVKLPDFKMEIIDTFPFAISMHQTSVIIIKTIMCTCFNLCSCILYLCKYYCNSFTTLWSLIFLKAKIESRQYLTKFSCQKILCENHERLLPIKRLYLIYSKQWFLDWCSFEVVDCKK